MQDFPFLKWFAALVLVPLLLSAVLSGCVSTNKSWARAANAGDAHAARQLILTGKDLDTTDTYRDTALLWAVRNDHKDVVEFLLKEKKADVNETHEITAESALIYAAKAGNLRLVSLLLFHGADPVNQDQTGRAAVDWAAQEGHNKVVAELTSAVRAGASDGRSNNTLVAAVHSGNLETVKYIVDGGANVGAPDDFGDTPFVAAAKVGDLLVARYLIDSGADFRATDRSGRSAFILAVQSGSVDVAQLLIDLGVDARRERYAEYPAIFFAAANGQAQMLDILLANGSGVHDRAEDELRQTPLLVTAQAGHAAAAAVLITHGADVNERSAAGDTPLLFATANGHAGVIEALLDSGADPGIANNIGDTPLYRAAINGNWFAVEQLLAARVTLSPEHIDDLSEDPATIAPFFEIQAKAYVGRGEREPAARSLEQAREAFINLADQFREKAKADRREALFIELAGALVSGSQAYVEGEVRRENARRNAQITALGAANSAEEYFALNQDFQRIAERSLLLEERASAYQQFDWINEGDGSAAGSNALLKSESAAIRASLIDLTIECIRDDDAKDPVSCWETFLAD